MVTEEVVVSPKFIWGIINLYLSLKVWKPNVSRMIHSSYQNGIYNSQQYSDPKVKSNHNQEPIAYIQP